MDKSRRLILCTILLLEIYQLLLPCVDGKKSTKSTVISNEALSSPSSITAMKNSAVWLHWNYTFDNAGGRINFAKQQWLVNDTALNVVTVAAEKVGLNGQMNVVSLPSALAGRIHAFPSNSTLMIKNLQFNDTQLNFLSVVDITLQGYPTLLPKTLKPTVNINIKGAPQYLFSSSTKKEVTENGLLSAVMHFDGNPKPTAEAQWSDSSAKQAMTVDEEYPFVYKAEYSINQITSSFCGRTLTVRAENSVGKSADIIIAVTVILSLKDPSLRASKQNQSCVEVQWQKKESGLCNVTYTVNFKDKNGTVVYTNTEVNKPGTTKCGIPSNMDIDQVELIMSSTKRNETFTALVSEKLLPTLTTVPKKKGANYGAIIGGTIGGLLAVILLVLLVIYFLKRGKWSPGSQDKSQFLQLDAKGADSTTVEQSKKDQISEP